MKQKTLVCKGCTYHGTQKGGKVNIKVDNTAKGQQINLATYDIASSTWQLNSRNRILPDIIKRGFELTFGEPLA